MKQPRNKEDEVILMKIYEEQRFTGERALFQTKRAKLSYCTFADGESPLKESAHLVIDHSMFQWKYPLWYCKKIKVTDSTMFETARAGIWYTDDLEMRTITYDAPKGFRRCHNIALENITIPNAEETLWNCDQVTMKHITANGDYFGMGSTNIEIDGFTLTGNYSFDGVKNMVIRNARMLSKDAFWNSENVTVYDSFISGEYLGWNSKNVTLINCTIESEQGMCYMENVVMKNCKLLNTNLSFEYSTIDAEINSSIDSIKNPISGKIIANHIGGIIFDNDDMEEKNTEIVVKKRIIAKVC